MASLPAHKVPDALIRKIGALPPARVKEVEDFVDLVGAKDFDRQLTRAVSWMSEAAFAEVWDNPEDDIYNDL
jgi:hypothetical protein